MRGQLSLEAAFVAGMVVIVYAMASGVGLSLGREASDRIILEGREAACSDFAAAIDSVYFSGDGAEIAMDVSGNYTVRPGFLEADGSLCTISIGSVEGVSELRVRRYTIRNRGGTVEFT
jgi:hypothetical protein